MLRRQGGHLLPRTPASVPRRTPVANSRGVPHILEHSVLCGSRKYPIKVGARGGGLGAVLVAAFRAV